MFCFLHLYELFIILDKYNIIQIRDIVLPSYSTFRDKHDYAYE
jgi:hypothetical protein